MGNRIGKGLGAAEGGSPDLGGDPAVTREDAEKRVTGAPVAVLTSRGEPGRPVVPVLLRQVAGPMGAGSPFGEHAM